MQETEKLPGDAADVNSSPTSRRCNRGARPWREVIGEFRASGLTIEAYSERSGISRSSMTRYLALARQAEPSGDIQNVGAMVAVARTAPGFMRVGIVDRAVDATGNGNSCDVPESASSRIAGGRSLPTPSTALAIGTSRSRMTIP